MLNNIMDEKILKLLYRILIRFYKESDDYQSIINSKYHINMPYASYPPLRKIMAFVVENTHDSYSKRFSQTIILISLQDAIEKSFYEAIGNKDILSLFIDEYNKQHDTNYTSLDDLLKIIMKTWSTRQIPLYHLLINIFNYSLRWAKTTQGYNYWNVTHYNYVNYINSQRINDLILKNFN